VDCIRVNKMFRGKFTIIEKHLYGTEYRYYYYNKDESISRLIMYEKNISTYRTGKYFTFFGIHLNIRKN
jgi:hypothetical protein